MNFYMTRVTMVVLAALILVVQSASAQTFPSRQVRIVEGFNAGAGDATIRLAAHEMSKLLGQPVIVEPIVGASGILAANTVAKAPADGYTLLFLGLTVVSDVFYKSTFVDAEKNFEPISNLGVVPYLLSASKKLPVKTYQELVAYSKKNPGKLNLGSPSNVQLLMAESLKEENGISFQYVPYSSPAAVMTASLSGDLDLAFSSAAGWGQHARSGAANVLFVTTNQRISTLPDVATALELGIRNLPQGSTIGLWAPRGTPQNVIQRLSTAAAAAMKNPEVVQKVRGEAILVEPDGSTPAELLRIIQNEYKFYANAARRAKLEPQ